MVVDGKRLWVGVSAQDPSVALLGEAPEGCPAAELRPLALRPPEEGSSVTLGDLVAVGSDLWFFYTMTRPDASAPFGVRTVGYGVGRREGDELVPRGGLLWAGDAPPFGRGAVAHGGYVYVYGCQPVPGDFRAMCYGARAPEGQLDQAAAWTYSEGSGRWGSSLEQALVLVEANDGPSLRRVGGRFVMVYTPVLGGEVVARAAPSPEGPWSRPVALFRCVLPGEGWFCADAALHPGLGGDLGITYAPLWLDPFARAPPRLVPITLPPSLP